MEIIYKDIKILNDKEKIRVLDLVKRNLDKVRRDIDGKFIFIFKKYEKEGERAKYSVNCKVDSPNIILSAHATEWDIAKVMHMLFDNLEREIQHRFKIDAQPQEKFHPKQK